MGQLSASVRSAVLWSHERGTIPYDVMCASILLFVFLAPSSLFRDQPALTPSHPECFGPGDIFYTMDERGNRVLGISARLVPPNRDETGLKHAVKSQVEKFLDKPVVIVGIKPIVSADGETMAYSVWLNTTGPDPF